MADAKHVELGLAQGSESGSVTMNPMVTEPVSTTTAQQDTSSNSRSRYTTLRAVIAVLAVTNLAALAVAGVYMYKDYDSSSSAPRASTTQVYAAGHGQAMPASRTLTEARSTNHFRRSYLDYTGTDREGKTVASGVNRILDPDTGDAKFDVHTEMVNDLTYGEYAGANGRVGDRSMRFRIQDLETGEEVIFVPHSLSFAGNYTLMPNHFFWSYKASPNAKAVATHLSTIVPGRAVLFNDIGRDEWAKIMPKFFQMYEKAWKADHPSSYQSRRRLGFGSWAAGKVGGAIGGHFFGDTGRDIGSATAQGLEGGQSIGSSFGGAVGGEIGGDVGKDVGEDIGAAAGGALGTAIGGPVGGWIGEEVGGWAGGKIGGDIGHDVGQDLGSRFGNDIENDIKSW